MLMEEKKILFGTLNLAHFAQSAGIGFEGRHPGRDLASGYMKNSVGNTKNETCHL
ncbi:uncharacterized protein PHALS_13172 [Plasmopara halstedii]|uniref:Uncharacterized protein n=1 Tax=Plasmopara halstedii TaxID=4781 RepID=A0A0N7L606_PLAHL|nr:uncharacterized protein PHALS_13172 [Plasmopara halstedii]CEG42939.1 hypothetical protein PHALS_13172 [Plasmopara halstedii]|eukprot:XP_024579308.1 hypothetical protein PHALS_13172 [Plasmopara halstedii]